MKNEKAYETALKNIIYLQSNANDASKYKRKLDEKIKYQRLRESLGEIHGKLLTLIFDIQDMDQISVEKCPQCKSVL